MGWSHFSEGDYIRTIDGLFFAVKGGKHSDELVVAILRYIPDENGERSFNGIRYRRVYDIGQTTQYIIENHREYLNHIEWLGLELQSVPKNRIADIFKPARKLGEIINNPRSKLEKRIIRFVETLSTESGVDVSFFGLTGSMLIGLETPESDIDLNVYGESEGRKVYDALRNAHIEHDWVSHYDEISIEPVLMARWGDTGLDLERFRRVECNKVLHGLISGIDYFIRLLVKEEFSTSTPMNTVTISATVTDSSHAIYTPCIYKIKDVVVEDGYEQLEISELKSYRGKFTEQVKQGDRIKARGTLEKVYLKNGSFYRLMLGRSGDYLFST
jgi:predicted nucleotidyltransferase